MTPIFYTLASIRADGAPLIVSVHTQTSRHLLGTLLDGEAVRAHRRECLGKFQTLHAATRALNTARATCAAHNPAIRIARATLNHATQARDSDLRRRIAQLPGQAHLAPAR